MKHNHKESDCSCHTHKHHHEEECCCHSHEHNHDEKHKHHHEEECCCHSHEHNHDETCSCGHNHNATKKDVTFLLIRGVLSVVFLVVSFFVKDIFQIITLSLSYIIIAYDIVFRAIKNIFKGKLFDENFLMTLASLTALLVFFIKPDAGIDGFDGVLVILLYQVGEFFQHYAADKSKKSISSMLELNINNVTRLNKDNQEEIIRLEDIKVDDILIVKPGDTIPTDGVIIYGNSSINTSSLTGESKPLDVSVNDKVLSGYINNDGIIHIKAVTVYSDSTSSKVMKLINEASKKQATGERFITKFAKIYTPVVILVSLFVMFVIPLILGFEANFTKYLYKGLSLMVISCPCALVISVPLSYFMGIGRSAKNAILVKGGSYLELLSSVDAIAFDKTGTLTKGSFEVKEIISEDKTLIKNLLYAFEKNVSHPIGQSITYYLKGKVQTIQIDDLKNIPGYGMKGLYNKKEVLVGNYKLLKENNIETPLIEKVGSVVYVSYDNKYLGYALVKDSLKDDSIESINKLNEKYEVYLISGDNERAVKEVADSLNIKNYYYEMLPDQKEKVVSDLTNSSKVVYVGDGINDASCLLKADVGVAMKSLGSDIAINASDIVIMDDKISSVNKAISISKKTMNVVKTNISISIGFKILVMILAMIIKLPMFIAVIADVGVCLLAILNSLTIMYGKTK